MWLLICQLISSQLYSGPEVAGTVRKGLLGTDLREALVLLNVTYPPRDSATSDALFDKSAPISVITLTNLEIYSTDMPV